MYYSFGATPEMGKLIRAIQAQQNPQPEQQTPEKIPSGTDIGNIATAQGLAAQNQQMNPPNPYTHQLLGDILETKQIWGAAQDIANNPEDVAKLLGVDAEKLKGNAAKIQDLAHKRAELIRNTANSAGIDLSDVGEGVTLEDATRNLASRQSRDIIAALQGQYSLTSDQFYQKKFEDAIRSGLSARQARNLAGNLVREYQAQRVAYLDGVYNTYGRDGLVTNEYGNQFIAAMASENPTLANFYAQIYPNATNEYNRASQLEQLAIAHDYGLENMLHQFDFNQALALLGGEITRANQANQSRLTEQREERSDRRKFELKAQEIAEQEAWIKANLKGEDQTRALAAIRGIKLPTGGKGNGEDAFDPIKGIRAFTTLRNSIANELRGLMNADPEANKERIAALTAKLDECDAMIAALSGQQGTDDEVPKFTGNWNEDKKIVDLLREEGKKRGLTWQQIKDAVYKRILADTSNEEYARGAAGLD